MSMNFGTHLLPTANKTYVLGSNAKKWDDIQTDKINGIDAGTLRGNDIIKCETPSFSSLPQTFQDARVTADHELVQEGFIYLTNPAAMAADDWKVTTSNGSYTISGTISDTTAAKLSLSIPCTHTEPDLLQLQQNVASLNSQIGNLSNKFIGNTRVEDSADNAPIGFSTCKDTAINNPSGWWCTLLTFNSSESGYGGQVAFGWAQLKVWYRSKDPNGWKSWVIVGPVA